MWRHGEQVAVGYAINNEVIIPLPAQPVWGSASRAHATRPRANRIAMHPASPCTATPTAAAPAPTLKVADYALVVL